MKKVYSTPKAVAEEFEANEYVAACWGVGCAAGTANTYEINHSYYDNGNVSHADGHCGLSTNQKITTSGGVAVSMTECGTDGLGNLSCTIYTDDTYTTVRSISTVSAGDYIYWTTSSGTRTWHHQGTVYSTYEGHPNRS